MVDQYLTSADFEDFMQKPGLSIVVFTATWCAPCQDLKKTLHELQQEVESLSVAYIDIEAEAELSESFGVRSVPLVMVVRDAVVLFAESGSLTLGTMRDLVQQAMQLDMDEVRTEE